MTLSSTITKARKLATSRRWPARMVRTELDAKAVIDGGCWFDEGAARHVLEFFSRFLRHSKGQWAGQPFEPLPWQRDAVIFPLFGWKRADGSRRFRKAGIWVPKKNGKSTMSAGLSLYLLVGDQEPGAEVYTAANDRDQASIIFRECESMVKASPELESVLECIPSRKTITFADTNSVYRALSADVPTKEGLNISGLVVDELHAQRDRALWDALIYGGAARRQPLMISISTAGIYDPTSIGWEQWQYAQRVANGTIEDTAFLSVIYGATPEDDWTRPATWKRANPSFGVTVQADQFAEDAREAQDAPEKQNNFLRYRLNLWVQQVTRAIDLRVWDENHAHEIDELDGRAWYGGLDLGGSADISAWVLVSACPDDPEAVDVRCRFWLPEAVLEGSHQNVGLYRQWARDGYLQTTPGNVTDERFIQQQILEDVGRLRLVDANIDRAFQGMRMAVELQEQGVSMLPMGQGFLSMAVPTRKFLGLVTARRFHHGGHPILRWMADNVVLRTDPAGNHKVDKSKSIQKVDGIVAAIMALDRLERQTQVQSVYDTRGAIIEPLAAY